HGLFVDLLGKRFLSPGPERLRFFWGVDAVQPDLVLHLVAVENCQGVAVSDVDDLAGQLVEFRFWLGKEGESEDDAADGGRCSGEHAAGCTTIPNLRESRMRARLAALSAGEEPHDLEQVGRLDEA